MPPHRYHRITQRAARVFVLWLLAIVLPMHSVALGVLAALGPAHVHRQTDKVIVLEDTRRWRPSAVETPTHVFTALGHFHSHQTPHRHHHAPDDPGVVYAGDRTDGPDEAADTASVSALAWVSVPVTLQWAIPERVTLASRPLDTVVSTRSVQPLDRPPKSG